MQLAKEKNIDTKSQNIKFIYEIFYIIFNFIIFIHFNFFFKRQVYKSILY